MNWLKTKITYLKQNRIARLFILIFTGSGLVSVFSFISLQFITSAIGHDKRGILVVVIAYTWLFFNLFSFKSFQSLIKFMTDSVYKKDHEKTKYYIKCSFLLDIISLLFMLVLGIVLRDVAIKIMNWDEAIKPYTTYYLVSFLFFFQGTTQGVLKTFEKYHYVVTIQIVVAAVRCIAFGVGFFLKADFAFFFWVEILVTSILNSLGLLFFTFKTLKENHLLDFYKTKLYFDKEFIMFNIHTNLTSMLDLPVNQITTLIVNGYLGNKLTSILNAFEMIGQIIYKLAEPINQIIFPEISQRISRKDYDDAKNISNKLKKYMGILGLVVVVGVGLTYRLWLGFILKVDPDPFIIPLLINLSFLVFINAYAGVHSLFLGLGYVKYNVPILIVVDLIYLVVLNIVIVPFGLTGVMLSYFMQAFLIAMAKEFIIKKNNYRERRS